MTERLTRHEALLTCRDRAGSDSALARDLGETQPKVWRWINQAKQMPAEHVLTAERLYGVSRHDLRPDIYPRDLPPAPVSALPLDPLADDDQEIADPATRVDVVHADHCSPIMPPSSSSPAGASLATRRSFPRGASPADPGAPAASRRGAASAPIGEAAA